MKSNRLRYIFLFLACMIILVFTSACFGAEQENDVPEKLSFSDVSASVTESTQVQSSSTHAQTTVTSSTSQLYTTTSVSAFENAPGVFQPNYKAKYYIVVHIGSQSVAVYGKNENGYYNKLVNSFTCSTGREGYETPPGKYIITNKFRWRWMDGGVYGQYSSSISKYYLFHSVPYLDKEPNALDVQKYDLLGSPASHGCIRLCVRDAKWIYDNCNTGTQVYITNTSGPAGAGVPERNPGSIYDGWDPTDRWAEGNPYFTTTTADEPFDYTEGDI